ncbi:MAG: hypothetical protein ACREFB_10355 [Stellaceae bacterium]
MCERRPIVDGVSLVTFLADEIAETAADPSFRTCGLLCEHQRVSTLDPDEIREFQRFPGDRPVLRDAKLARERLEFGPLQRVDRALHDAAGRPLAHALSRIVEPALIAAAASAFRPRPQRTALFDAFGAAAS